jgi:hypothetical protein
MFFPGSRYGAADTDEVTLTDGTVVVATRIPPPVRRATLGWHRRADGERLDLIAYRYLNDATAFWQLCEVNDAMVPDALAARDLIAVPPAGA